MDHSNRRKLRGFRPRRRTSAGNDRTCLLLDVDNLVLAGSPTPTEALARARLDEVINLQGA